MEAFARKHWPEAQVVSRWATQDCMTLDSVPYIGPYGKNTKGLWVATGFNKWGMTSAMVAAKLLRDGVQGIENPWAQVFSPQRSVLHSQLAVNAFEAAANVLTPVAPDVPTWAVSSSGTSRSVAGIAPVTAPALTVGGGCWTTLPMEMQRYKNIPSVSDGVSV